MNKRTNRDTNGNRKKSYISSLSIIYVFFMAAFLLLAGCSLNSQISLSKKEDGKTVSAPQENQETADNSDNSKGTNEVSVGFIIADEVRVRDRYDNGSEVIELLNIGRKVRIVGKSKEKQTIGGYEDYWYNIEFDGKNGWCYGEFISDAKDLEQKLEERFDSYLSAEGTSIKGAATTLSKYMEFDLDTDFIDTSLRKIRKLQDEIMWKYESELKQSGADYVTLMEVLRSPGEIKDENIKRVLNIVKENGFSTYQSEGDLYLEPDSDFYLKKFEKNMSDNMRLFLNLELVEVRHHFAHDAGLMITWDELADRIENWDYYIRKYPETPETKIAKEIYQRYLRAYVRGMDNTSLFDYQTKKLKDEVKKSYEKFIGEYGSTKAFEVVKSFYDVLKKNNFELTNQVREYMNHMELNY